MYYEIKAVRTKRKKILINITPLIDVLFLLLIFFMVSSTFLEQPALQLDLPSAATAQAVTIDEYLISVTPEEEIFINDSFVKKDSLREYLTDIAAKNPDAKVILKADTKVSYGCMIDIIDAVRQSGLKKLAALTKLSEEK